MTAARAHRARCWSSRILSLTLSLSIASALCAPEARGDEAKPARPKIEDARGTPVTFVSTRLDTEIYLVHGFEAAGEAAESFEKIGVAPMTIRLAPGVYTIQTSSPSTSLGYERVRVDGTPMKIELRPGDETVKTLGGVFEGLGVTGILLAVIVAISISPHDQNFDRWAIAVPAFAGGLGSLGLGVGLSVVGSTRIVLPRASAQATTAGIVFRF